MTFAERRRVRDNCTNCVNTAGPVRVLLRMLKSKLEQNCAVQQNTAALIRHENALKILYFFAFMYKNVKG